MSALPNDPAPPDAFVPDFVIDAELGRGGTAVVYQARSVVALDRPLVLKVSHGDASSERALHHEAFVLRHLAETGLAGGGVSVLISSIDVAKHEGRSALALAPVGVRTLRDWRTSERRDAAAIVGVLRELARSLAALHGAGVVHGDVAPTNMVLTADGSVVLIDFAAAVANGVGPPTVRGTLGFAAPEVRTGIGAQPASDVYALGLVGRWAFTGAPDSSDDDLGDAGCPPTLTALLSAMTADDPTVRPSAAELALRLASPGPPRGEQDTQVDMDQRITREFGPRPPRPAAAGRSSRWPTRLIVGAALVGALVFGFGGRLIFARHASVMFEGRDPGVGAPTDDRCPILPDAPVAAGTNPGAGPTGATVAVANLDGGPCPTRVIWQSGRAELTRQSSTGTTRYGLGQVGDQLVVGDWDGDRQATPALYRPATGEVFTFDTWATADGPAPSAEARSSGVTDGVASVRHGDDHDMVEVTLP